MSHCSPFIQKVFSCILIVILLLSGCASEKMKENTISISGAFALYPLVVQWSEEYQKEHPGIRFNISGGGAGKGMADALSNTVDLGMVSREIAREEIERGAWWVGLAIDAVVPTISAENPYAGKLKESGMTRDEFRAVFVDGTVTSWGELLRTGQGRDIVVYTRSDACGAAGTWAKYLGGKQEELKGIGIYGDPGLAEAVIKDKAGIAYNNVAFAYDIKTGKKRPGVEVIPIDINENGIIDPEENFYDAVDDLLKAIGNGGYPSPPARELYVVSKGGPSKQAVREFLRWTLTTGQQFVKNAGYVPVDNTKLNEYLEKLD